ncbi:MAG: DUF1924 domain-containing protein [Rhodocyclaceae bacterium]|jgi:hypothetical protein|nr:DUF1924 domain-containing protein [Rhodocyclaceae bacterium]
MKLPILSALTLVLTGFASHAAATTAREYQATLVAEARAGDAAFQGFSAARGDTFFHQRHNGDWSCATCHTDNPAASGLHAVTHKTIRPLAPAANAERFTSPEKIEKWFKRNCNDVLKRACTAREKGDLIDFLLTVKP